MFVFCVVIFIKFKSFAVFSNKFMKYVSIHKAQIAILIEFMETHPELAKSYNAASSSGRVTQRQLWEKLARTLNSNEPPTKSIAEWKRVWTLRKYSTKKKLSHNIKTIKLTGGGPYAAKSLDEIEESIIKACGMEASVSGVEGGLAFGSSLKENYQDENIDQLLQDFGVTLESDVLKENIKPPRSKKAKTHEEDILKQQIELQENYFTSQIETNKNISETLIEIRDAIRELSEVRKNEIAVSNSLKKQELEIRVKELELAKTANDIKLMELNSQRQ